MSTHVDGEFRPTTVSHNLDVFWRINQVARRADAITEWALENMGSNMSNGNSLFTTANISNLSVLLNSPSALYAFMNASRLSNMSNLLGVVNASNLAAFSNLAHFFTDDGSNLARLNYLLNSLNTSFLFDQTLASNLTALAASASNVINGSSAGTWSSNATAIIASNASFSSNAVSLLTGNMNLSTMSNFSNIFSASNLSNLSYIMSNDDCAKGYCKQMSNALASISNVIAGGNGFLNQIKNLSNLSNLIMNPDVWTLLYGQPSNLATALSNFSNYDASRCKWTSNALASISNLTSQTQGGAFLNIMSNLSNLAFLMSNVNSASTLLSAANMSNIQLLVRDSNAAIDAMNCCKAASNALGSNLSNVILASSNGGFMNNMQVLSNLSNVIVNSNAMASILAISPILSNIDIDSDDCCKSASNALTGLSNVISTPFLSQLSNLSNLSNLITYPDVFLSLSNYASNALLDSACCKWASNQLGTILSNLPSISIINNLSNLAILSNLANPDGISAFLNASNLSNLSAILSNASSNDCCVWASNLLNTSLSNVLTTGFLNGLSNLSNLSNLSSMLSNASFLINNSNLSNFSYSITTAISVSNITNFFVTLSNITNIGIDTSGASNWNWASNSIGDFAQYYAALLSASNNSALAQLLVNSNVASYLYDSNALSNLYGLINTSNITNITNITNIINAINMADVSNWNWASNAVVGLGSNLLELSNIGSLFANGGYLSNFSNLINNSNTAYIFDASNLSNLQYLLSTDLDCCKKTSNALGAMIDATGLGGEVDALFQASNLASLSNLLAAFYGSNGSNGASAAALYLSNIAALLSNPSECCAWASNAIASVAAASSSLESILTDSNALASLSNALLSNFAATASIFNASNMSNIASLLSNYDFTCQEDWASNQASASLALIASTSNTSNTSLLIDLSALSNLSNVLGVGFGQGMFNASNLSNLTALLENYDPNECAWASNAAAKLSNLTTSNASFIFNLSNLSGLFASASSNYSNAASVGAFASNLAVWTSNTLGSNSNQCKVHWSFESSNPSFTSNITGVLPRFVYNSNDDSTWFIDCDGTAMSLKGLNSNATTPSSSQSVISFKTTSELTSLAQAAPAVGNAYIVAPTGTRQSDIATWTGSAWDYLTPKDGDRATVMVTSGTYVSGIYTYDATLDLWKYLSPLPVLSNDGYASTTTIVGNVALSSQDEALWGPRSGGTPIIVGDRFVIWDRPTDGGVTNTGDYGYRYEPRSMTFNWSSMLANTDWKAATHSPVFVDVAVQNTFMFALDSRGKVWVSAINAGISGTGMTWPSSSNTLQTGVPFAGFSPLLFFHERDITIRKMFVGGYQGNVHSAALATNGDVYVTGNNGVGQLGQGFQDNVIVNRWIKYPMGNVKNVLVTYLNIFVLTVDNKLYMTGRDLSGYMRQTQGTIDRTTPWLVMSDVKTFSMSHNYSIYIVKTDGTLWVAGTNNFGQLGINSLVTQYGFVQVPGITNAVSVVPHEPGLSVTRYACLLRSDGTISFAGQSLFGEFGYELHTTNNGSLNTAKVFVTPTAPFQGRVKRVALGYAICQVLTTAGELFNTGLPKERGIGRQQTQTMPYVGWWVMNSFIQVPIPDPVEDIRMAIGGETDGTLVLTTKGRVYVYGSTELMSRWNSGRGFTYAPSMVPYLQFSKGIPVASAPAMTI